MQQYKVGITFVNRTRDRIGGIQEITRVWYLDADSDVVALTSVIEDIKRNGPDDADIKGIALIELENTKIL